MWKNDEEVSFFALILGGGFLGRVAVGLRDRYGGTRR